MKSGEWQKEGSLNLAAKIARVLPEPPVVEPDRSAGDTLSTRLWCGQESIVLSVRGENKFAMAKVTSDQAAHTSVKR
jgi:hypothetical protein